ncbi:MAG: M3 family oligoendopeptidase [Eubacterium sp.]|nr:M3 family oligoendopeptidase [Eubacterium sp.]
MNQLKFKDMPYERPDLDEFRSLFVDFIDRLKNAADFDAAWEVFLEEQKYASHVETMGTLVSIRHSIDTRDAFYEEEQTFWDQNSPEMAEMQQQWLEAMLISGFRTDFEEKIGTLYFRNAEIERETFDPAIIPELKKENELTTAYGKLIASAQIPFRGGVYTLSQMSPFKTSQDDEVRAEAWKAEGQWYRDNQPELDRIYDELVHLRDTMGRKLGFDGYTELGYRRMTRNCYDKNDVEEFRKAVREYLVPVADGIYRRQAARIGKAYPMDFADNALSFRSGNPRPQGTPDEIVAEAQRFYDDLSPETSEFFRTMRERELMDLLSTEGKEGGGYCTTIHDYHVPFIFANFNGTQHDVEVVTHEAGHAFASWMNRDRVPSEYIWPTLEACEVHSMSMEFFAESHAEGFFGKDAVKFRYSHLADALTFIPYGTMVDHFQHIVYEKPDMTPAERHGVWKELLGTYMPWVRLDGVIPFYGEGMGWQRQSHIYEVPFYYIDYCLAQTVALEFWALIREDRKNAWEHYMAYTRQGGTGTFREILAKADLESPFEGHCLKTICSRAEKALDEFDPAEIV